MTKHAIDIIFVCAILGQMAIVSESLILHKETREAPLAVNVLQKQRASKARAAKTKKLAKFQAASLTKNNALATLPDASALLKKRIVITAYSSTKDQTDDTPCITANGFDLCTHNQENILAANFVPMGTKIRIPEYFGEKIFIVQDRMNARYYYRADIWMQSRQKAKQWGAKYTEIEVLK